MAFVWTIGNKQYFLQDEDTRPKDAHLKADDTSAWKASAQEAPESPQDGGAPSALEGHAQRDAVMTFDLAEGPQTALEIAHLLRL